MYYIYLMALATLLSFINCFIFGMDFKHPELFANKITYRQATQTDVEPLLDLINFEAANEKNKIVILPKLFRKSALEESIKKGRYFVAAIDSRYDKAMIVGFKKLYCITDLKELVDLLTNELRAVGTPISCGTLATKLAKNSKKLLYTSKLVNTEVSTKDATYIYDGGDFTHHKYRNKGHNTNLTEFALKHIKSIVLDDIAAKKSKQLFIAYGLTNANSGINFMDGRTPSIAKLFIQFANSITNAFNLESPSMLVCRRYPAFMPTFDPNSQKCIPLSDENSVPGYGYLLEAPLKPNKLYNTQEFRFFLTMAVLAVILYVYENYGQKI